MKIVLLDGKTLFPSDLSLDKLQDLGEFTFYENTSPDEIVSRIGNSEVILINKAKITEEIMIECKNLKLICVTATGFDNVDVTAARQLGIGVCNVPAYSTQAVAQHAFSLILQLTNHVCHYNSAVENGMWQDSGDFCFMVEPISLLAGKSLGIVGYGNIGKCVGAIGKAFGMNINVYSQNPQAAIASDIVTLHCPATQENRGFVDKNFIKNMKDGAILINTARGSLINETDLAEALACGKLSAAGLDVLSSEPPASNNPLLHLKNCVVTPHIAWMPTETRQSLMDACAQNIEDFLAGKTTNRVDL